MRKVQLIGGPFHGERLIDHEQLATIELGEYLAPPFDPFDWEEAPPLDMKGLIRTHFYKPIVPMPGVDAMFAIYCRPRAKL